MGWRDLGDVFIANTLRPRVCFQILSRVRILTGLYVCEGTRRLLFL